MPASHAVSTTHDDRKTAAETRVIAEPVSKFGAHRCVDVTDRNESCIVGAVEDRMGKKAKKAKTKAKSKAKRSTQKRERLTTKTASHFAKRTGRGRFKELDEMGRSQRTDRTKKAKKKAKSGYGDQGDR